MESSGEFSKDMRRRLRKRLKEDLIKIQGLSSKLEARALQLLQSRSVPVQPSFSDAQISGNDVSVRSAGGKEVTSQLNLAANGTVHHTGNGSVQHTAQLTKQQSFGASNGSLVKAESLIGKRTPKVSQVYNKSEFLVGKEKLSSPGKVNAKMCKSNGQETRMLNEGNHKRKLPGMPNESRAQCRNILKKLMGHEDGWIFNEPVDAVKLGLSDYHSVIKKPMDFGTVKNKLEKRQYASLPEFADDVKLTLNNAMTYNPPGNDVHQSAKVLQTMFQKDWDVLNEQLERTDGGGEVDVLINSSSQGPEAARASSGAGMLTNRNPSQTKNSTQEKSSSVPAKPKLPSGKPKAPVAKSKPLTKPETPGKPKGAPHVEAPVKSKAASKSEALAKPKCLGKPKASTKSEALAKPKAPAKSVKSSEKAKSSEKPKVSSTKARANVPKKVMTYEEKVRLQALLGQLPQNKLEELIYLMRERNINMSQEGDEIEVDLDSFDDDTLWELDRRANECLRNLQKDPESRKRPREDNYAGKTGTKQKGLPAVAVDKNTTSGNRSSSDTGSSTDSDSGSSSTSDSDG
eukprot:c16535_g1_i1 orf=780-2495(+)